MCPRFKSGRIHHMRHELGWLSSRLIRGRSVVRLHYDARRVPVIGTLFYIYLFCIYIGTRGCRFCTCQYRVVCNYFRFAHISVSRGRAFCTHQYQGSRNRHYKIVFCRLLVPRKKPRSPFCTYIGTKRQGVLQYISPKNYIYSL